TVAVTVCAPAAAPRTTTVACVEPPTEIRPNWQLAPAADAPQLPRVALPDTNVSPGGSATFSATFVAGAGPEAGIGKVSVDSPPSVIAVGLTLAAKVTSAGANS